MAGKYKVKKYKTIHRPDQNNVKRTVKKKLVTRPAVKGKRWDAILSRLPEQVELIGAEVGVLNGNTSHRILKARPQLTLYMIDPWRPPRKDSEYYKTGDDNSHQTKEEFDKCYETAKSKTEFAGDRAILMKQKSLTAVKKFEDKTLDFVFIDGDHSYKGVKEDIIAWLPKVKGTGFISGHDYNHPRLPGVKQAVDELFPEAIIHKDENRTWFVNITDVNKVDPDILGLGIEEESQ
jgi:hypothetical protein